MSPAVSEVIQLGAIPLIAGAIGYATNRLAVRMMFRPLQFVGVGPIGWQGVIPSRATKMGSISVDTGLAKLGSLEDFYRQLDPERIAQHIVHRSRDDVRELVERFARQHYRELWRDLPPEIREEVHRRVQERLPAVIDEVTEDIGDNIDQLMDLKLMVVQQMERRPELANRIFEDVGDREFRFIIRSGFYFGVPLGLVQMGWWIVWPSFWVLPIAGLLVGYVTNWLAIRMIFRPLRARRIGPFTAQGLFLRRQDAVSRSWARLITDHVLTLENIRNQMLHGPSADRTRRLIEDRLRPAVDEAIGMAEPAVRLAVGGSEYDAARDELAAEAVDQTLRPLSDRAFGDEQGAMLERLIADRMRSLSPPEYTEVLRSAFREDEWRLIGVGAALGLVAGVAELVLIFGGSA